MFVCILTSCNRVRPEVYDVVLEEEIFPLATKLNSDISPPIVEKDENKIVFSMTDLDFRFQESCNHWKDNPQLICIRKGDRTISEIYNEVS